MFIIRFIIFHYFPVKLLKNLHLFYLNRFLRMFPVLAATILLQASVLHYIYDGAMWNVVAIATESCRTHWWLTFTYVQNFFTPVVRIVVF